MRKIVDLTLLLSEDLPCAWPAHMPFKRTNWNWFKRVDSEAGCVLRNKYGAYHTGWMVIDEHTGTHFDAPSHYVPLPDSGLPHACESGRITGDKVDISKMLGDAVVVDISHLRDKGGMGTSPLFTKADMIAWEKENGGFSLRCLRDFLCGVLIGAGAILPGVSGGVLAVIFDLYRPFMELLTHPKRALPKYWRLLIPLGLGWAAGFFSFAKGVSAALDVSAAATTWAFIGLIVGTIPALYREAGEQGRTRASYVSLLACAGAVFGGLFYVSRVLSVHLQPDFWSMSLSGALFGLGIVVPGLATSSVLMALDLYQPVMDGLSTLNAPLLASILPGMALTVALLALVVSMISV